jgi:hypothetical protein
LSDLLRCTSQANEARMEICNAFNQSGCMFPS